MAGAVTDQIVIAGAGEAVGDIKRLIHRRIREHVAGNQRVVQKHRASKSIDAADRDGGDVVGDRGVGQGRGATCVVQAADVLGAIVGQRAVVDRQVADVVDAATAGGGVAGQGTAA